MGQDSVLSWTHQLNLFVMNLLLHIIVQLLFKIFFVKNIYCYFLQINNVQYSSAFCNLYSRNKNKKINI